MIWLINKFLVGVNFSRVKLLVTTKKSVTFQRFFFHQHRMPVSIVLSRCSITDTYRKFITWQDSEFSTITFAFLNVYLIAGCELFKQVEKV